MPCSARTLVMLLAALAGAGFSQSPMATQDPSGTREQPRDEIRLPNGKLQQREILKADHQKSLEDARQLVELSQTLQKDLEHAGADVLSVADFRKTEEIEKIAKRLRGRLRHY